MNISELAGFMWALRHSKPQYFEQWTIDGHQVYHRKAPVVLSMGELVERCAIWYADQNPRGKSPEANMVRSGILETSDIGWMWITRKDDTRMWLAKIVKGVITVYKEGEYNPNTFWFSIRK